jgi:hypothetical protein
VGSTEAWQGSALAEPVSSYEAIAESHYSRAKPITSAVSRRFTNSVRQKNVFSEIPIVRRTANL